MPTRVVKGNLFIVSETFWSHQELKSGVKKTNYKKHAVLIIRGRIYFGMEMLKY